MDEGTLAFKTDTENLGTAMKGLQHLATGIYAAVELDANGDEITMKYLGGAGMCIFIYIGTQSSSQATSDNYHL